MQSKTWIELFQRIPEKYYEGFGIITSSGTAINLQSITQLDEEVMVFRGRLVGTTDVNQIFFLPYAQINFIVYQRVMKQEEFQSWFGAAPVPVVSVPVEAQSAAEAETPAEPVSPVPSPEPAAIPAPVPIQQLNAAPMPGKATILERLRKRNQSAQGTEPKPPG